MKYRVLYIFIFTIGLLSCQLKQPEENTPTIATVPTNLWVDQTSVYLPETAEWTNRVEVADLNGDSLPDLIFANGGNYSEPGTLEGSRVFLNNGGDQRFTEISKEVFGEEKYYARVIKTADLNQDGNMDFLIGATFQHQSQLYLGMGEGKFQKVTTTHLPQKEASIGDLEFGDVDQDGDLDVMLVDWGPGSNMSNSGGTTLLWLNDGSGKFTDVTESQMPEMLIQFSWELDFIDYDNDFDLDVAISCKRCGNSLLFENDGNGVFMNKRRAFPAYTNNYEFEPMDVNKDGFLDLITINDGEIVDQISWSRREHIFLNDSAKRFLDATAQLWPDSANIGEDDNNIAFLDYDSDGDADFLVSSLTGEDRLQINDGDGNFSLAQPVLEGKATPHTLSLVLSDLNRDGKLDIVMGQGEGRENIEERIFIGHSLSKDSAPPIISHYRIDPVNTETMVLKARIHDHKSPLMPLDWKSVSAHVNGKTLRMTWYGEYLWRVELPVTKEEIELCATDFAGNTTCLKVKP